jgi:hypothetical protein
MAHDQVDTMAISQQQAAMAACRHGHEPAAPPAKPATGAAVAANAAAAAPAAVQAALAELRAPSSRGG